MRGRYRCTGREQFLHLNQFYYPPSSKKKLLCLLNILRYCPRNHLFQIICILLKRTIILNQKLYWGSTMHGLAVNIVLPHALIMVSLNQYWSLVIKLTYLANQLWISSAILLHRPITNNILIFVVLPHKSFTNNFWFCRMKSCGPKFGRTQGKFNLAWGQHPDIY